MSSRTIRYFAYRKEIKLSLLNTAPPDPVATDFQGVLNMPNPADYIRRIDLSHWETVNDWDSILKAGVTQVYMKVTEGVGTYDITALPFAEKAKSLGLEIGYYHFGRPDTKAGGTVMNDALAEADDFLKTVAALPVPDLPPALDLEESGTWDTPLKPADYLKWLETFLARIEQPGEPPPYINSRKSYLEPKLPANHGLGAKYPLWLSRYHQDYNQAITIRGWKNWSVWQFTDSGKVGNGNTDLDLNWVRK